MPARSITDDLTEKRIDELIAQLTLEEKVGMCDGSGIWHSTGVERLGIPPIKVTDGPNGARGDGVSGATAACFPVGSALGATWSPELMHEVGRALAFETKSKGAQVLLGPTVNLHRHPVGGRHFECYSEDPHLTSRIAVGFIEGLQSERVSACIKHYVCNDTEFERHTISSDVDERTLRELYLPPFEAAVKEAGTGSIMSAYNKINGTYASSHERLLRDVLKTEWGFEGFVVSDWGAAKETVENARGGLDLAMPGPCPTRGEPLLQAVEAGEVDEAHIDDMVRRILRVTFWSGRFDSPEEVEERSDDRPETRALARRTAAESMVLVKNDGVLPFNRGQLRRLAVIGPNAKTGIIQGGGSSGVKPHHVSHPLDALREAFGDDVEVTYSVGTHIDKYLPGIPPEMLRPADESDRPGLLVEYRNGDGFDGEVVETRVVKRCQALVMGQFSEAVDPNAFTMRYTGSFTPDVSGVHGFGLLSFGKSRLYVDDELLIDNWDHQERGDAFFGMGSKEKQGRVELQAGEQHLFRVDYQTPGAGGVCGLQFGMRPPEPDDLIGEAVATAEQADAVVLVIGTNNDWETEGNDRTDIALPGDQDELVRRVLEANPSTVVVLNAGAPVTMPWLDDCRALLLTWFPGQEFGHALADVLTAKRSPSGRMPTSWPKRIEDTPANESYPGSDGHAPYTEGLRVGYRHYDTSGIEPAIPFGHGLGYSEFVYSKLDVPERIAAGEPCTVSLDVANAGDMTAQEVVQCYVHRIDDDGVSRPDQELRAFAKIELGGHHRGAVELELDARAFSTWDTECHDWRVAPGRYELRVGASSRDIRSTAEIEVTS